MHYWARRKEALEESWKIKYDTLAPHIKSVLGPNKNLLLFQEMLEAVDCPDSSLVCHLMMGFPLVGSLPRSGTLQPHDYETCLESRDTLHGRAVQVEGIHDGVACMGKL